VLYIYIYKNIYIKPKHKLKSFKNSPTQYSIHDQQLHFKGLLYVTPRRTRIKRQYSKPVVLRDLTGKTGKNLNCRLATTIVARVTLNNFGLCLVIP